MGAHRRSRIALVALACAGTWLAGCAGLGGPPPPPGSPDHAFEEALRLCQEGALLDPDTQRRLDRRTRMQDDMLASGLLDVEEYGSGRDRQRRRAESECLADVEPLLRGPAGAEVARLLRLAGQRCEADGLVPGTRAYGQCLHVEKLEVFAERHPDPGPEARGTLDRLLALGGGEPLSDAARAAYCRTRELGGTGHPMCPRDGGAR